MNKARPHLGAVIAAGIVLLGWSASATATNGHFLHGVGAINSAMGGAAIGQAEDTLGALFANPATIGGLGPARVDTGFELFKPERSVESTFGPFSGKTDSESDFVPIPAFGIVERPEEGRTSYGLGVLAIAGFGVDYPLDDNNPILAQPASNGFGHVYSSYQLMKITPAMAMALTPKFSLGFALNMDWASLGIEPMPAAPPGPGGYPSASNQVGAYGGGFQAGVQYGLTETVKLGLAYTSNQWFQKFHWNSVQPGTGAPQEIKFRLDVPPVIGGGIGWSPRPDVLVVADLKWIQYASTRGFDQEGFNADGSVKGFGWKNIWTGGFGARLGPMSGVTLRAGYNYSQNPVPDDLSFFNVPSPAIVQHHITAGFGTRLGKSAQVNLGYYHAFANSGEGPMQSPAGPVAGSSVKNTLSESSWLIEVSQTF